MMFHSKKQLGFSLIELMVVLAIMAVSMSLTGGLITNVVSKQERFVEIEKVKQLVLSLKYKAFYTGSDFKVDFIENRILITGIYEKKEFVFNQLIFSSQKLEIYSNGTSNNKYFETLIGEEVITINLPSPYKENEKV
ncbi:type II secretion system protein [Pseudoalteromonas sp. G4]|uniref:type II secretion system protein n=1 Tax=Pseudoalteromonas sp. G4 TaxID=2992761 RepID=UPI00237DD43E|nr:type II secretion system protein [Pseudoalteromonas sp. G4]MDE3271230.1 type II secretion system GspH family protein [Pseudoalteromonas sp. G4]